jgi:hypothetical protein
MKSFPLLGLALALALFASGCARYYRITTNSGRVITTKGKPHYDKANSVFVFKDMHGVEQKIPAGSVSQISPASDTSSPTSFNPKPGH